MIHQSLAAQSLVKQHGMLAAKIHQQEDLEWGLNSLVVAPSEMAASGWQDWCHS